MTENIALCLLAIGITAIFWTGFIFGEHAPMNPEVWECTELALVDGEPGCNVWRRKSND